MGSTRLPNKVMRSIVGGLPMIEVLLSRLSKSKEIDQIVLATSLDLRNKVLVDHVSQLGYDVFKEVRMMYWIVITKLQCKKIQMP